MEKLGACDVNECGVLDDRQVLSPMPQALNAVPAAGYRESAGENHDRGQEK